MREAYEDIPGTTVFDAKRSRQGYHLNMFCMSLMKAENRDAFKADERAYLDAVSDDRRSSARRSSTRDWNGMLELGGNIYYTSKLGATDGLSFQHIAAMMTGSTQEEYAANDARRRPLARRQSQQSGVASVARIIAGVATSHVPAIGAALDNGTTRRAYWQPLFARLRAARRSGSPS